jgi:hypothetical protein
MPDHADYAGCALEHVVSGETVDEKQPHDQGHSVPFVLAALRDRGDVSYPVETKV